MKHSGIRVENLMKQFGEGDNAVSVIKGASFEVEKGELAALIAPSGAGKSTLLMMIGCVLEPSSGKIWLGDTLVYDNNWSKADTRALRREKIGFIFQAHYLIPFLNVLENVSLLPLTNKQSEEQATQISSEFLTYLGLEEKLHAMPSDLSGGQNQRVAIARALATHPEIILADEPTAALDIERAHSVVKLLRDIAKSQKVAIIMVTHDERLLTYCDKILKIVAGKIETIDNRDFEEGQNNPVI
ncbi:ABC transporter ATP-binding protein [Thiomicrorhabdus chilensis]|uniref:ABC transporter ATP-binding protein n=1 Tax=Thiomicrorhabdus chilensis TaxID=63656 RepID=UPI0003FA2BC9|nr:ABC transporter ATP-binding protein [Thiomicrorhabdus chilensis]